MVRFSLKISASAFPCVFNGCCPRQYSEECTFSTFGIENVCPPGEQSSSPVLTREHRIDGMDRSSYHVPAPAALAERFAAEVGASVLPRNLFIRPGSLEDAHIDEAAETLLVFLTEGAVFLPAANETVTGRAGRLVAWSNVLPDGRADRRAMHRGIDPPTGGKLVVHMGWNGDDWMCACPCVYLILLFSGRFFFILTSARRLSGAGNLHGTLHDGRSVKERTAAHA